MRPTKLSRKSTHAKAMVKNLATSLVLYERVVTTPTKARVAQAYTDRLITLAKRWAATDGVGEKLALYRQLLSHTADELAAKKLTEVLADRFATRAGGYTRRLRLGRRLGDAAEQVVLSLTDLAQPAPKASQAAKAASASEQSTGKTAKRSSRSIKAPAAQEASEAVEASKDK